jgi:putative SOS response-associated peptidase YedK
MCDLFTLQEGPAAILDLAHAMTSHVGNLELGDVYPDYAAPIVRQGPDGGRELVRRRWGMRPPPKVLVGKKMDQGVSHIRIVA